MEYRMKQTAPIAASQAVACLEPERHTSVAACEDKYESLRARLCAALRMTVVKRCYLVCSKSDILSETARSALFSHIARREIAHGAEKQEVHSDRINASPGD